MYLGIDLGLKNLGLCFLRNPTDYETLLIQSSEKDIEGLAAKVHQFCYGATVFVDFHFNEIFLPGRRKTQALKYYLAGTIKAISKDCIFIAPKELREYWCLSAKASKQELHETVLKSYPNLSAPTEHEMDAILLALTGYFTYDKSG